MAKNPQGAPTKAKKAEKPVAETGMLPAFLASVNAAKDVFYFLRLGESSKKVKNADSVLRPLLPLANINLALLLLLLSGVIITVLSFLTTYESRNLANFASDTLTEATGVPQAKITMGMLVPVAAFQFLLYVPINLVTTVVYEA